MSASARYGWPLGEAAAAAGVVLLRHKLGEDQPKQCSQDFPHPLVISVTPSNLVIVDVGPEG